MPAVARAAGRALDASVALIDRTSNVLAVAAASPDEEKKLLAGGAGVETVELRVADNSVGELRWRPRGEDEPDAALLRMVATLVGLELERSRSPEWATEEAAGGLRPRPARPQDHRPRRHRGPRRRARHRSRRAAPVS